MWKFLILLIMLNMIFCLQGKSHEIEVITLDRSYYNAPPNEIILHEYINFEIEARVVNPTPGYIYWGGGFQWTVTIPGLQEGKSSSSLLSYMYPVDFTGETITRSFPPGIWEYNDGETGGKLYITAKVKPEYIESQIGPERSGIPDWKDVTGMLTGQLHIAPTGSSSTEDENISRPLNFRVKFFGKPNQEVMESGLIHSRQS